jgi:hypothetical protein
MSRTTPILVILSLMLSGCLPIASLHPFYTEETVVVEPNLVGTWTAENMTWEFEETDDKTYGLRITEGTEDEKIGAFKVHVFRLEGALLMDLYPEELPDDLPLADFYKMHLFPVHHIMRLSFVESQLHLRFLELDKMVTILEAYPHLLRYEVIEKELITLTDAPEAIQTFFSTFIDYEALWSEDPAEFERKTPEETPDSAAPIE